jgi:hypothetical protein
MKKTHAITFVLVAALLVAVPAMAATTGFVGNPGSNSSDWATYVTGLGGWINTSINFDTHPTGALQANFYSGLGVTLAETGTVGNVNTGAGPGQGNTSSTPLSAGEGLHQVSNYVWVDVGSGTFTMNFATPVMGAGLFIVDYFNPQSTPLSPITIAAYNSTNALLGSYQSAVYNFQENYMYFMGIASTTSNIAAVKFTITGGHGDQIGLDDIRFAGSRTPIPGPATILLLAPGLAGLAAFRKRIRKG